MTRAAALPTAALAAALAVTALAGCTRNQPGGGATAGSDGTIAVKAGDDSCAVSADRAKSGSTVFAVTNTGSRATEFELLAKDGLTIVGEIENIGPGLTRSLSVQAQPGAYTTVCKPGMTGTGVGRSAFTVTGKSVELTGDAKQLADQAAGRYVSYVRDQSDQLLTATTAFAAAYTAKDDAKAKALYPGARAFYERIEPVAESFGDLDPQLDARVNDVEKGTAWTGWHRIEKDLWAPDGKALDDAGRKQAADFLVTKTTDLKSRVDASDFTVTADAISNGAVGLLDEVATSKITGEEEAYSHTDLWDFKANVQGSEVAYRGVRDIAEAKDPALVTTIDGRYADLNALLAKYGTVEKGFTSYDTLSKEDVKALSDAVNALGEPLSKLTSTVLK